MANEAVPVELGEQKGNITRFICHDHDAFAYGQILFLGDDNREVSGSHALGAGALPVAGICAAEKVADDGQLHVSVYTTGIFDCLVEAQPTPGTILMLSGGNCLVGATVVKTLSGMAFGKLMEAGPATAVQEVCNVQLGTVTI